MDAFARDGMELEVLGDFFFFFGGGGFGLVWFGLEVLFVGEEKGMGMGIDMIEGLRH